MVNVIPNQHLGEIYNLAQGVLMVDSEPFVGELLKSCVPNLGHIYVGRASNYQSMENLLNSKEVDMVFINLEMKGELNGIQIAKLLKIEHDIPFYFVCSKHCIEMKKWSAEINPDGYLNITTDRTRLNSELKRILD